MASKWLDASTVHTSRADRDRSKRASSPSGHCDRTCSGPRSLGRPTTHGACNEPRLSPEVHAAHGHLSGQPTRGNGQDSATNSVSTSCPSAGEGLGTRARSAGTSIRNGRLSLRWEPNGVVEPALAVVAGAARLKLGHHPDDADQRSVILTFERARHVSIGFPNDEGRLHHRLWDRGLTRSAAWGRRRQRTGRSRRPCVGVSIEPHPLGSSPPRRERRRSSLSD